MGCICRKAEPEPSNMDVIPPQEANQKTDQVPLENSKEGNIENV